MIFGSALTPEQLAERRKGIGASEAAMILEGGEAWIQLWKSKTGRGEVPFKMSEWDKALRHTTEGLQADWYAHKTGLKVDYRGQSHSYEEWPVLRCTLDGFIIHPEPIVFEAKHLSPFTPGDPIEWAVNKYFPQVQHQMIVMDAGKAILSVIVGMNEPVTHTFTIDPFFKDVYIERCKEFWHFVETDEAPPGAEKFELPPIPYEKMREVDMAGSNEFASFAADWVQHQAAAKTFKSAEAGLKKLIEKDVKRAYGYTIEVKRNRAGALTIKGMEE
jgi:predicted phage-related endonuclease